MGPPLDSSMPIGQLVVAAAVIDDVGTHRLSGVERLTYIMKPPSSHRDIGVERLTYYEAPTG